MSQKKEYLQQNNNINLLMSFVCLFIAILVFHTATATNWTQPTKIIKFDTLPMVFGMLTDFKRDYDHLFFWNGTNFNLSYLRIHNNAIDIYTQLTTDNTIEIASLAQSPDGQNLFIAFEDHYEDHIYFLESSNSGQTWTQPIKLSTKPSKLGVLKYIEETNRLYILYHRRDTGEAIFLTRPAGSSIFTPERVVWKIKETNRISSAYTLERGQPIIHAISIELGEDGDYVTYARQSKTLGATWEGPNKIPINASHYYKTVTVADPKITDAYFIIYRGVQTDRPEVTYSMDHGKTYGKSVNLNWKRNYNTHAMICGDRANKTLIVSGRGYAHLKDWEEGNLNKKDMTRPFDHASWVNCKRGNSMNLNMFGRYLEDYHTFGISRWIEESGSDERLYIGDKQRMNGFYE
eukprot:TRINITY_DN901_c0_g2_i1.p1 TRINITY_DN901_c0_g2~~TRINITY_DN901_c0_g2_i1.p1  ORF type:complete len:470 (-),score=11.06 TRINITY_DN901_c0_g2_i1:126-1340(-)